jgi:hypothetical protein
MGRRRITKPGEGVPPPEGAPARCRDWEKRNPVTGYRLPVAVAQEVKRLADVYHVPVFEMARFLLEKGMDSVRVGEVEIRAFTSDVKLTLYPRGVDDCR